MTNTCEKAARRMLWLVDKAIGIAIIVITLLVFCFGSYAIWDATTIIAAASPLQYEVYKPDTEEGRKTFQEFASINKDTVGWLTVYGTNIDYPLMHTDNNQTYLTTSAEGKYLLSGAIFLDYRNQASFTDFNTIIYGHNMTHGAMFSDISDFKGETFFGSHRYGNLYYDGKDHGLEFFAFVETDVYKSELYIPGVIGEEEQKNYMEQVAKEAMYTKNAQLNEGDRIVLLTTCTEDITNGRHILVGKITDEAFNNAYKEEEKAKKIQSTSVDNVRQVWDANPLGLLMIIGTLTTILAGMLLYRFLIYYGGYGMKKRKVRRKER